MIKLYRAQKQFKYNNSIKSKARFIRGDDVIVISGDYKGHISKIKRRYNNDYYLLETQKETNSNLENKIKKSKFINEINIKVHESNIMHYDVVAKSKSHVRYFYLDNKFRIRVYKASGTEKQLYIPKKQMQQDQEKSHESSNINSENINEENQNNINNNNLDNSNIN
ncbi:50S ribosomal protein L24 [uncultured bacterium]|nr:50S ribosomal protein L24 [uncultured bacterium]